MEVGGIAHGVDVGLASQIKVDHLATGVYAGIGAASGERRDGIAAKAEDGFLQGLLHRWAVVLPLPPDEGAAVILEGQFEARHGAAPRSGCRMVPCGTRKPRRNSSADIGARPGR